MCIPCQDGTQFLDFVVCHSLRQQPDACQQLFDIITLIGTIAGRRKYLVRAEVHVAQHAVIFLPADIRNIRSLFAMQQSKIQPAAGNIFCLLFFLVFQHLLFPA